MASDRTCTVTQRLLLCTVLGLVISGLPYWLLPLKRLSLPDALPAYAPVPLGPRASDRGPH
jgi:hypothetical protein